MTVRVQAAGQAQRGSERSERERVRLQIKNANKLTKVAYQGHVTDLANKVLDVARASNNGALISALQLSGEWQDYEVNRLAVRTKVQDVNAWNVGRPPTLDHTISSQDDDEDGTLRPLVHFMGKQDEDENPMVRPC